MSHSTLPPIQIFTFGTLQVVRGDHLVTESDWHTRQARQLLKILITERPRPVSTDRLIEILWPQSTPDAAATTLRSAINALRNVLEPERPNRAPSRYIVTQTPGYAFHLTPDIWLDIDAFEQKLVAAQHAADPRQRRALFEGVVALYQDDYLVSDPYADWAETERERLRERYFTALLQLAELDAQAGEYTDAISTVRRILARDEVRENAYQALMRYQAESGDSAGALLTFERCRTILADELGADPSPLTQLWHQRILNGEIAPRESDLHLGSAPWATAGTHDAATARPAAFPQFAIMPSMDSRYMDVFVGREAELDDLRARLDKALAGKGDLLVLVGEAGVGKTRLAIAALQQAADSGATVVSAECQALEKNLPFAALADGLGRYLHRLRPDALHALPAACLAQMAQIIPSLYHQVRGLHPPPPGEPAAAAEENRQRLIDGIVAFLAALAELRPLALFLDDLQWGDTDTLAVLSRLSQRLGDLPIFLLLAYRSEDLAENEALATFLHAARRARSRRQIEVARLGRTHVAQLVNAVVGTDPVFSGELARLLHETTQGNPLFVAESLRDLQERDPALLQPGGEETAGAGRQEAWLEHMRHTVSLRGNQRVQELILERIERLSDKALWVLQLGATIARDFSLELLETATPEDPLEGLELLLERKFLIERPDQRLDFSHQVVREVAYDSMSALQKRRWHLRVADALVKLRRAEQNPAETAFHYGQAGANAQHAFAEYSILAGEKLLQTYGYRQANDYFDQALAALARLSESAPGLTVRALQGRGLAYESLFDPEGVTDSYRQLQTLAAQQGDRDLLLRTHSRLASILGLLGQDRESNNLLRELIDVLAPAHSLVISDLVERRRLIYSADAEPDDGSWPPYTLPRPTVADPVRDVLQVLEPLHAVLPLFDYGWTLLVQGQLGEATRCLSAVVDLAIETAQPSIASTALHQLAVTARILGELEQSQTLNDQSVTINRSVPGPASEFASMWPRIASALISLQAGRIDEAERRLRRVADSLSDRNFHRNYRNSATIGLGLVQLARGNLAEARALLDDGLSDPVNLYPYMHVQALLGLARIARAQGDAPAADALLRRSLRFAGKRSLLDEYVATVLEIAQQRPAGAPVAQLIEQILAYVRPVRLEAAVRRLEAALRPEAAPPVPG